MKIVNKKIPHSYTIEEKLEAGIELTGAEVKAIRGKHVSMDSAHVRILNGQAYLVNAKIFPYQFAHDHAGTYQETRSRRLLLHKKEIIALKTRLDQGNMTLVPLSLYTKNNRIKVEVALAKGKKKYEKRRDIKKKVMDRDAQEALKKWS